MKCNFKVPGHELISDVKAKRVPKCKKCMQSSRNGGGGDLKRKRASNGTSRSKLKRRESYEDESDDGGIYDLPEPGVMKVCYCKAGYRLELTCDSRTLFSSARICHQSSLIDSRNTM